MSTSRHLLAPLLLSLGLCCSTAVLAHDHPVDDLLELPHPMKPLSQPAWKQRLTPEQKAELETLRMAIQPRYLGLMGEALPLQEKLRQGLLAPDQMQVPDPRELQALAELRARMTQVQADAYQRLQQILGPEHWKLLLQELR